MKKRFTDEDIIRFLYDEMDQAESEALLTQLVGDEDLWQRYETLQEAVESASTLSYDPSSTSVASIQDYVRATRPHAEEAAPAFSQSSVDSKQLQLGGISINLQALVGVALGIFLMLTIAGSAIKLSREKFANPNTGKLVESEAPAPVAPTEVDPRFEWDMKEIDRDLEKIKEGLQTLEGRPVM
jgi:hypothetical protein